MGSQIAHLFTIQTVQANLSQFTLRRKRQTERGMSYPIKGKIRSIGVFSLKQTNFTTFSPGNPREPWKGREQRKHKSHRASPSVQKPKHDHPIPTPCLRPKAPGSEGSILNMHSGFLSHCQVGSCKVNLPRGEHLVGLHLRKGEVNPIRRQKASFITCDVQALPFSPLLSRVASSLPWNPMQLMAAPLLLPAVSCTSRLTPDS